MIYVAVLCDICVVLHAGCDICKVCWCDICVVLCDINSRCIGVISVGVLV